MASAPRPIPQARLCTQVSRASGRDDSLRQPDDSWSDLAEGCSDLRTLAQLCATRHSTVAPDQLGSPWR